MLKIYCFFNSYVLTSKSFKNLPQMRNRHSFDKKLNMMKDFDILAINQRE